MHGFYFLKLSSTNLILKDVHANEIILHNIIREFVAK
jgi:hypothetical protein